MYLNLVSLFDFNAINKQKKVKKWNERKYQYLYIYLYFNICSPTLNLLDGRGKGTFRHIKPAKKYETNP